MIYNIEINNEIQTQKLATIIGSLLNNSITIGIDGDLGAGKTSFTKGLASGLSIKETIKSPTFNLINEYTSGRMPLYHFDVYRLNSVDELLLIGFDEYIKLNGVTIIEWASLIKNILPKNSNYIYIKNLNNTNRIFTFDFSEKYQPIINEAINIFNKEL